MIRTALALLIGGSTLHGSVGQGPNWEDPPGIEFLENHCFDCHDDLEKKGDFDLSSLRFNLSDPTHFRQWVDVYDKIESGEMPPKKKKRPDPKQADRFLSELSEHLVTSEKSRWNQQGRSVIRRLNRVEFENSVSDLIGIPLRLAELLPPDAKHDGFDTVGSALNISSVQMDSYLSALDLAMDKATWKIEQPESRKWRLSYLDTRGMMMEYRRGSPFSIQEDGVAMFAPDFFSHFNSLLDHFVVPYNARYRVRVSAYSLRSEDPITLTVRTGGSGHKESLDVHQKLLGNVSVYSDKPQVFEFDEHLERGQMFRIYPSSLRKMRYEKRENQGNQHTYEGPAVVVQWVEVEGPIFESWPPKSHRSLYKDVPFQSIPEARQNESPNAHLDFPPTDVAQPRMTWGFLEDKGKNGWFYDPEQKVGGELIYTRAKKPKPLHPTLSLNSTQPKQDAQRLLNDFIPRAFRRPVSQETIQPYIDLVHQWLDIGASFEDSMRAGYKAVLVSPGFLFQRGGRPVTPGNPALDDFEFAERLSFFLWSSLPDDILKEKAASGTLRDPSILRSQIDRMLIDPKGERFLENFLGQWLDLRLIDFTAPDIDLYPEYNTLLKWSMVEETKAFFNELLTKDLSVRNVIDSDFAMLNDRLSKHYGIENVRGNVLRRVPLPDTSPRGGVLTQGSILKVTANGTTTSPVIRGVWVMERILGIHPDSPPPGTPAIEPDIRGATTIIEQLEMHRNMDRCSSCHDRIDPLGIALEGFDVIGGYRNHYRSLDPNRDMKRVRYLPEGPPPLRYLKTASVDQSGVFPDGRAFADIHEFKEILAEDVERIAEGITEKLVTYSTASPISFADREDIESIVNATCDTDYGFRSLLYEVINSPLFSQK